MGKLVRNIFNWVAFMLAFAALVHYIILEPWGCGCNHLSAEIQKVVIFAMGAFGLFMVAKALLLFLFGRPKFDWHMIYGNFLLNVITIVMLVPFIISAAAQMCNIENIKEGSAESPASLVWSVFSHFVDPGNIGNAAADHIGWATLIALLGVFLMNGLLIATLTGWIDSHKEKWLKGEVTYIRPSMQRYYIIIGGNDMVAGIVEQIFRANKSTWWRRMLSLLFKPTILIQTSRDVDKFRMELFSNLTEREQRHVIIYYGNRTSDRDIENLKVRSAKEVYIIGEDVRSDDTESYHDTMNMECLELIRKHLGKVHKKLTCHVMFEYQTTFSVFQYSEISNNIKDFIDFKPFNYYDSWAQQVLIGRTEEYLPLEGAEGIRVDSPKQVHLIIVGMSRMGISMAINAAHVAHYPNFDSKGIRTKITFIDKAANEEKDFFMGRFKDLFALSHWRYGNVEGEDINWDDENIPSSEYEHLGGDFLDIEWEFINGSVAMKAIQDYFSNATKDENRIVTIAICLPEPNRCLASALYLNKDVYDRVNQILVYNRYGDSLVTQMVHGDNKSDKEIMELIKAAKAPEPKEGKKDKEEKKDEGTKKDVKQFNPYHNKLRAFGMAYSFYDLELMEDIAYIANMNGRTYDQIKKASGEVVEGEELYGKSKAAKAWSNFYSASTAWCKLRCIGWDGVRELADNEVEILAKVEHARWNMEQLLMGYRPLTDKEQYEVVNYDKSANKKQSEKKTKEGQTEKKKKITYLSLKNPYKSIMAHLDLCSFKRLLEIDENTTKIDKGFVKILPLTLRGIKDSRKTIEAEELANKLEEIGIPKPKPEEQK